jgi:predicted PolB exonuclease-like 3'-5' exonuclease
VWLCGEITTSEMKERKKMIHAIDIETIPNLNLIDCLPEPELPEMPGNYKKQETVDKWLSEQPQRIAAAKQKQVDKMALSPYYGRICSVAVYGDSDQDYNAASDFSDAQEMKIIDYALSFFSSNHAVSSVVTWNGFAFDVPFLFKRAMLLKMDIKCRMNDYTRKYTHVPHCDMSMELGSWDERFSGLGNAAKVILGDTKIDQDVTAFIDMIKEGRQNEIGLYNLKDAELTYKLYLAAKDYIF